MAYSVAELDPKVVWNYFAKICGIPHGSGDEKALGAAILTWAREQGCEAEMDAAGSIVVRIPATPGREAAPTVILQGHMDMVCEKNADTEFDFTKDPIETVRAGDWLTANGTTLGADNGIGVATGLAFMDDKDAVHGPLEILITTDEERGLVGARALDPSFVKGRMLFNLDSEEDGIFYVGCAGGRDAEISLPLKAALVSGAGARQAYQVTVKGLRGGHSGMDIIHNRGNAIRLLARAIMALGEQLSLELVSIVGGDKHNAIPREAAATVVVGSGDGAAVEKILAAQLAGFRDEFASGEPELTLTAEKASAPAAALDSPTCGCVLRLLVGLPHGVLAMSRDVPGKVETSTNMASVYVNEDELAILMSTRSSIASAIDGVIAQIRAVAQANCAAVKEGEGYPGWKPNMDSPMLAKAREVWKAVHGTDAQFEVIHAGLECGIIGEKFKGMDMISLGPTIENPHSPDERVQIESVGRFYEFVKAYLVGVV